MKIYLGTDHAGFPMKEKIKTYLLGKGHEVDDCGAIVFESSDDYSTYIPLVAKKVSEDPQGKGIILGGSGQAEAMLANKFPHIRAALFYGPHASTGEIDAAGTVSTDPYAIVALSRMHNDANVLSIGARFVTEEEVMQAVEIWLNTPFSNEERHKRRIAEMQKIAETL